MEYYDNSNNFKGATVTKLQTGTKDYTRYAVTTTPTTDTAYAVVYGIVRSSAGTTYFDNLKLVPRSTTTYDYKIDQEATPIPTIRQIALQALPTTLAIH
ncbi:MAG: hypothetical protein IBX64_07700 [Actinobacteria bacterium]|nr:hypothetical protein [Actinomycetota bacterium]